jgi:hypothetical protein
MAVVGKEVKTQSFLDTPSSSPALLSIGTGYKGLSKSGQLPPFVETHFLVLSGVNNTGDVWNCHSGFCYVRGDNNFSDAGRRKKERRLLVLARDCRVKGIYKPVLRKRRMAQDHVVQLADLGNTGKEYQESTAKLAEARIIRDYLQQSNYKFIINGVFVITR